MLSVSLDDAELRDLMTLRLTPGLGPVRIARLVETLGSPGRVLNSSAAALESAPGIGPAVARKAVAAFRDAAVKVDEELSRIADAGVTVLMKGRDGYPPLLEPLPDAPPLLMVRGELLASDGEPDEYPVAMVGSRGCTAYGIEQAGRFAGALGRSGLTIVSGGARGIDTAAHRGVLNAGGRTVVVMGCGLGKVYPPENAELFDRIVAEGRGAVISELPMMTEPSAENFPARNRIISGLSLGVLVIEASVKSGALITARLAAEEHGREVMAVPGRVDSSASAGSNGLLRAGGAAFVTDPKDVIHALENVAHHRFRGTHSAMPGAPQAAATAAAGEPKPVISAGQLASLPDEQRSVMVALAECETMEDLAERSGLGAAGLRSTLTMMELSGLVERRGVRVIRCDR